MGRCLAGVVEEDNGNSRMTKPVRGMAIDI